MFIIAAWEKNVPTAETAASRYNRDTQSMRGDWQGATGTLVNDLEVTGKLVYDADGRYDREFNHRGGDLYYTEDGTLRNEADGRNSRIYVDRQTKLSAENGLKSRIWDSPTSARS